MAKLADAYGILGIDVDRHDDVPAALTKAFEHPGPAMISIKTNVRDIEQLPGVPRTR